MNLLGNRLRELREAQGLLLRQVAAKIDVDTALMSKFERGERRAQKDHIIKVARVLNAKKDELITLWLADRINDVIEDEPMADNALMLLKRKIDE